MSFYAVIERASREFAASRKRKREISLLTGIQNPYVLWYRPIGELNLDLILPLSFCRFARVRLLGGEWRKIEAYPCRVAIAGAPKLDAFFVAHDGRRDILTATRGAIGDAGRPHEADIEFTAIP